MLQPPVLRRSKSALDFSDRSVPLRSRMAPSLMRSLGMGKGKRSKGTDGGEEMRDKSGKSGKSEKSEKSEKSKEIDRILRLEKKRRDREIRVLLLGVFIDLWEGGG
jgi:hypothetical protein